MIMPGKVFSEQIADMIKSGCRKTIILLSPDYLESEWCSYEARMALHESPDCKKHNLIPIVFRSCQVPRFLEHIYYLDYPRYHSNRDSCQKFFWARLFRAVNHDPTKNGR
ncbi:Myeloid differentiation primary response protein MyD88 [Geodia barretti]|uniref:Myeloid differentiation primary response protein MyD88 n=1 Tax=Geodia barretti TaxID=519541 RepID=A0AA35TX91_GEOBA|nr:Myeloid differentiation primary response protein MyD88 [Geodia barretti]